jgi:glycosyltransferase involved in cell wall biosynthesis
MNRKEEVQPAVGILLDEGFDGWLMTLNVSLEMFIEQMMGSWVFNYAQALQEVGVKPVLYCVSKHMTMPTRMIHGPTGVTIVMVPSPPIHRLLNRLRDWCSQQHANSAGEDGAATCTRTLRRRIKSYASRVKAYAATPLFMLFRELRRDGCCSLLVQDYESPRFELCVLMGKLSRVPVFGTFTCGFIDNGCNPSVIRGMAIRHCAGLVIGGRSEAERVKRQYRMVEKRISLIYSSVDSSVFYPISREMARASLGIAPETKLAIYHGRIELEYKGLDALLDAWKLLSDSKPEEEIALLLIGTGGDAAEFATRLSIKQPKGIRWLNEWVHDRNLISKYLSAADVYVFPSRGDACPNAVIEAMACGLPVVASDLNGIADIVRVGEQSAGILVPPGDSRELARALGRIFADQSLRQALSNGARHRVETSFCMERVGHQLKTLLIGDNCRLTPEKLLATEV